jgi:hypothetical protein
MCCTAIQKTFHAEEKCFSKATSASENQRQFQIEPTKGSLATFCRIKVDGCLVSDEKVQKCDFVFKRCDNADFYFVELKGTDIQTAFNQITKTLEYFQSKIELKKPNIFAFIVASRVRPQQKQNARNLKKEFIRKYGAGLEIKSTKIILKR